MLKKLKTKTILAIKDGLLDGLTPSIKNSISKDENGKILINKIRVSISIVSWCSLVAKAFNVIPPETIEFIKNLLVNYVSN
jgi:hypothetical protein